MRCLHCGKSVPLLKRLAGSEFCSDAHRREYHHEYSELALGRLLQSKSDGTRVRSVIAPPLVTASAPANDKAPTVTAAPNQPRTASARAEIGRSQAAPSISATTNGIAKSQPPAAVAKPASEPATAKAAATQKPAPARLQVAPVAGPEFEHALASLAPDRPRRQTGSLSAGLSQGQAVAWDRRVEIADSLMLPMERKLELREVSRSTTRIALDLRIVPPESLETERQPLAIPAALVVPAEVSLWIGPPRDFASEPVSLADFANALFTESDFEAPSATGSSGGSVIADQLPPDATLTSSGAPAARVPDIAEQLPPEATETSSAESQTAAGAPAVRMPDPELTPLPVTSHGIAPGRAKALPVFGPLLNSVGSVQVAQPNGLPLRPVMVLAGTATTLVKADVKNRRSGTLSLSSDPSIAPSRFEMGRSEQGQTPPAARTRMREILAALVGAAVLGTGIFFFLGNQSDAGSKSPAPGLAGGVMGGQWIANFAPDTRRQRRVSVLQSSVNLKSYRLDFQSSIRIKALGWVYRAQDSKNFYVSKIELQRPGHLSAYSLVHYAVIDGVDQPRVETPLPVTVPLGSIYKIRFEAVGSRFTTWVQGQQVEQWTDPRLSSGGAGLYGEGVEQSILHGDFVVTPLMKQK